jgi:hypothetical protein
MLAVGGLNVCAGELTEHLGPLGINVIIIIPNCFPAGITPDGHWKRWCYGEPRIYNVLLI